MKKLKGKPVSPGIGIGKALLFNAQREIILREKINQTHVETEINRFHNAVKKSKAQLKKIHNNVLKIMGKDSALIIETQHMLLDDGNLINDVQDYIKNHSVKVEWAIKQIEKKYFDLFSKIDDISFQEKKNDISDILNRILSNLRKIKHSKTILKIEDVILIARDIPPSVAASIMSNGRLLGLALDEGGETSHAIILAKTLGIPTILHLKTATRDIRDEDDLIIDSLSGELVINPTPTVLHETRIKKAKFLKNKEKLKEVIKTPCLTKDNHPFHLYGNIELPFEAELIQLYNAKGIGLFRTEFLFSNSETIVSAEQQTLIYRNIAQKFYPDPVVIRTFDIGRDKSHDYFELEREENPSLGTMAVRLFLKEKKLFKIQIKSIIQANQNNNIRLLIPMVTEIEEIFTVKQIIKEVYQELDIDYADRNKRIRFGIMIEIPGAVKLIRHLRDEVDFFSIGTNDLIQYLLAVDRNNCNISHLYNPFHPAVVQTLLEIKKETDEVEREVTVCGEIAGQVFPSLMLLGMGYTNFSMNPGSIPEIKTIFNSIHYSYLKKVVGSIETMKSKKEIEEFLIESMLTKYPLLFSRRSIL